MLSDLEIIQMIDEAIVSIWKCEIKTDYEGGWLLKDDTLKNALYFHLRSRLGKLFDENNIRFLRNSPTASSNKVVIVRTW